MIWGCVDDLTRAGSGFEARLVLIGNLRVDIYLVELFICLRDILIRSPRYLVVAVGFYTDILSRTYRGKGILSIRKVFVFFWFT